MKSWQRKFLIVFTTLVFLAGIVTFFNVNIPYSHYIEIFFWLGFFIEMILSLFLKRRCNIDL